MPQIILSTVGSGTWTVPPDCISAQVELIGAGQSGWIATNNNGGAGGDYAKLNAIALTPGATVNHHIGAGGAGSTTGTPNAGGDTWFSSAGTVLARGGGSLTPTSIGDVVNAGGAIALSGGGGAGGPNGAGNASPSTTGGSGDAGFGGSGGGSGASGNNGTEWGTAGSGGGGGASVSVNGGNGGLYGAGGGGARSPNTAGAGANGVIVITYTTALQFVAAQTLADASVVSVLANLAPTPSRPQVSSLLKGDVTTFWDVANIRGDWMVANAALASGDDLTTATLISLFTDRRANADDVLPDGSTDRRGWWGDLDQDVPIGSRLWLLSRAKLTPATARTAKGYISEALQWMLDDGVAATITIATSIVMPNRLYATVDILRNDGSRQALNFNWAWNQLN